MPNPLIQLGFEIPFDQIEAAHVEPAIDALLARVPRGGRRNRGERRASYLRQHACAPLEDATEMLERSDDGRRSSGKRCDERGAACRLQRHAPEGERVLVGARDERRPLSRPFAHLRKTDEAKALPPTEKRFLKKTLDDFRRHGAELGPEDKAKLQEIEVELTKLTTEFSQNVLR